MLLGAIRMRTLFLRRKGTTDGGDDNFRHCYRSLSLVRNFLAFEIWLGGLDSNQDSQIQNLESCQLDDLPTVHDKNVNRTTVFRCVPQVGPKIPLFRPRQLEHDSLWPPPASP